MNDRKVFLINYACGSYLKSQKRNRKSAISTGVFTDVISYSISDIDDDFKKRNASILEQKRGAGYWLWKPYLILKTMTEKMKDGDLLMYSDSGCSFISSPLPLLDILQYQDIVGFTVHNLKEYMYNTYKCMMACDAFYPRYYLTDQIMASFMLIKKNKETVDFVSDWLRIACMKGIIDDSPSDHPEMPGYREHRHDQAIFSLLYKKRGYKGYRDPSQYGIPFIGKAIGTYTQIIDHHRNNT